MSDPTAPPPPGPYSAPEPVFPAPAPLTFPQPETVQPDALRADPVPAPAAWAPPSPYEAPSYTPAPYTQPAYGGDAPPPYAATPADGPFPAAAQPGEPFPGQPVPGRPYPAQPVPGAPLPTGWPAGAAPQAWPPGAVPPGYGHPSPYAVYPQRPPTDGMAVGSMVTSLAAIAGLCFYGLPGLILGAVGAILGHVSRRRIKQSGAQGDGMALTGIIVGWVNVVLGAFFLAAIVFFFIWAESLPTDQSIDPYYDDGSF